MSKYIKNLISQGEHQQLDFKFEINDSKKIARTFVAFANTDGGRLLVGVKDNGAIAGIRSDEEFYMLEAAATMYCKPIVIFKIKEWQIDGKTILEVNIPKSKKKPHLAPGREGKWLAWVRVADQNILANDVIINVWKNKRKRRGVFIEYSKNEKILLDYLSENQSISLSKFCKIGKISRSAAKKVLTDLISINLIKPNLTEESITYGLAEK